MVFPGFTNRNEPTYSLYDDEMVRRIIERHYEMMKKLREQEFTKKLKKAKHTRSKGYEDVKIKRETWCITNTKTKNLGWDQ